MTFEVKVNQFIETHQLLTQKDRVLIGVSGGPDSLALLNFLNDVKEKYQIEIAAITVDHTLRGGESKADAAYVETWCEKHGIVCYVKTVDVLGYQLKRQVNTQLAARILRYEAYNEVLNHGAYNKLALAHHLDDQLETSLMAFIKAVQPNALTGIPISRLFNDKRIIRPFLNTSRHAIETYVTEQGLTPRQDLSNLSHDYLRNRMRHSVIPSLKKENKNILKTNAYLRQMLTEDEQFIQSIAETVLKESLNKALQSLAFELEVSRLEKEPDAVLRRVFRMFVQQYIEGLAADYKHEDAFLQVVHDPGNKLINLPDDWLMVREYEKIVFRRASDETTCHYKYQLDDMPFSVYFDGCGTIRGEKSIERSAVHSLDSYTFPLEAVALPLHIRTKLPGDRMTYDGLKGSKKINRIFIDQKVPPHVRKKWPIVTDAYGRVLWLPNLKKCTVSHSESSLYINLSFLKHEGE